MIGLRPDNQRRSSAAASGLQASQFRTQPSQPSFSQGLASQHSMFSQLSQSSLDEVVTNNQKTLVKFSCLATVSYTREESEMPMSRSSTNLTRKWNPVSASNQRCQIIE